MFDPSAPSMDLTVMLRKENEVTVTFHELEDYEDACVLRLRLPQLHDIAIHCTNAQAQQIASAIADSVTNG